VDDRKDASGWEKREATSASFNIGYEIIREQVMGDKGWNGP
jgi:hypothetical protein